MSDVLHINRWQIDWLLAMEPSRASAAAADMTREVVKLLPERLEGIVLPAQVGEGAIVFIDALELDGQIGTRWAREAIAERIAAQFSQEIARKVATAAQDPACVVYRDRAEYVASYLAAACVGAASGNWRYADFAGLAMLSPSAATRTLAIQDPRSFVDVLRRFGVPELELLLHHLTDSDASRVLALYSDSNAGPDTLSLLYALSDDLTSHERRARFLRGQVAQLGSFALLVRKLPLASANEAAAAITSMRALLVSLDVSPVLSLDSFRPLEWLARLAPLDAEAAGRLIQCFAHEPSALSDLVCKLSLASSDAGQDTSVFTALGGVWMLTGLVVDLGIEHPELPAFETSSGTSLARGLLISYAAGGSSGELFDDDHLKTALGIAPSITREQALDWFESLEPEQRSLLELPWLASYLDERDAPALRADFASTFDARFPMELKRGAATLLRAFAFRLPGFAASSPSFLRRSFLACDATLTRGEREWRIRLARTPLDLVIRMTRLKSLGFYACPDGPYIQLEEAP